MQLGVRFYDSAVGRFTQRDPLTWFAHLHPYSYADSNPLKFTDPTGLLRWEVANSCQRLKGKPTDSGGGPEPCEQCCNSLAVDTDAMLAFIAQYGLPGRIVIPSGRVASCQFDCEDRCRGYCKGKKRVRGHFDGKKCVTGFAECLLRGLVSDAVLGKVLKGLENYLKQPH